MKNLQDMGIKTIIYFVSFLRSCTLGISAFNTTIGFRSDYTYSALVKGWIKVHTIPSVWKDARLRCQFEGAELMSPTTPQMLYIMNHCMPDNNKIIFTGIHCLFSDGDFTSIEGVRLIDLGIKFKIDGPAIIMESGNSDSNCVALLPDGSLDDVGCESRLAYVCYKKDEGEYINACGTIDPEYHLDIRTNRCYKLHKTPRTWSRAYMACAAEDGHLAIINNPAEAQILVNMFQKLTKKDLQGIVYFRSAFIGFHDWNEDGEWLTIFGETLQKAGYDEFEDGQPNNKTLKNVSQHCGSIFASGLLNDFWCDVPSLFFCEKTPYDHQLKWIS